MHDSAHSQLKTYSLEQARAIWNAAWDAYQLQQFKQASELYTRAFQISEAIDWAEGSFVCRIWAAMSIKAAGQYQQALAVLAPILQMQPLPSKYAQYYLALTSYVEIAINIPTTLTSIEAALTRIAQFLQDTGYDDWRSHLIFTRAKLLEIRNQPQEALRVAQESWACWRKDAPGALADAYLFTLIALSRKTGNRALAQHYVDAWQRLPNDRPLYGDRAYAIQQAWLARWDRRLDDALEWARRAVAVAEQTDQLPNRFGAYAALVRAFLCRGQSAHARLVLLQTVPLRHAQNIHIRWMFHNLRGDVHLACAREAAGMPPIDDTFAADAFIPKRLAHQEDVRRALQRARGAYQAARRDGRVIEEQLACSGYQAEIGERLSRVAAIEQRIDRET